MPDLGIWGYVILIVVVLIALYLFPKFLSTAPKAAETAGSLSEHFKLGRLKAQREITKFEADVKAELAGANTDPNKPTP